MTVPDFPQTRLAFRTWLFDKSANAVRSLNAPVKKSWMGNAMASPEGCWPHKGTLTAACPLRGDRAHEDPVPGQECTCGIYATTDLDVISIYLAHSRVVGVVELGGRVIPATQGYRAAAARVAAILLLDEALTEPHPVLRRLAAAYKVPAIVPHSTDPEDYRDIISTPTVATEAEEWLKGQTP